MYLVGESTLYILTLQKKFLESHAGQLKLTNIGTTLAVTKAADFLTALPAPA
jgi:hypothetical protein